MHSNASDGAVTSTFHPFRTLAASTQADLRADDQGGFLTAMPRELIDTGTDKRYVRRDEKGQFKESMMSAAASRRGRQAQSKKPAKKGEGDRGDR